MKKPVFLTTCAGLVGSAVAVHAIDLKESKITQVVNDVEIISAANQSEKQAKVNDAFDMPDVLRTGAGSRAELIAADETVTRVGANTIFSFDPANRTIDLKQGSLLFHSVHGKGGGTIHTGAATASVLGTTLVVTTTPSGGLKVLDLEGNVEVKFLNGLKQSLDPGQMTFVLPGGKQLAPIIVFRLDDVVKHGQLLKGFNNPLSSLSLIEQQIQKQMKLIKDGRYTDTGLLVGNDATSDKVQVLGLDTLQTALDNSGVNSPAIDAALNEDVTFGHSLPPQHVFPGQTFVLPNNSFFAGQAFEGFAARNIFFDSPNVDFSPYGNSTEFDMVADRNIYVNNSVSLSGFSEVYNIFFYLVAGGQFIITPGADLTANVANLEMASGGSFDLSGSKVINDFGNTEMAFGGNFSMENGAQINALGSLDIETLGNLTINDSSLQASSLLLQPVHGEITMNSATLISPAIAALHSTGNISLNNSTIYSDPGTGQVRIKSDKGSINLQNNLLEAQTLVLNSGDGILLDGNGQQYISGSGTATFTAPNVISVNNADLSNFAVINMAANTIDLINVILGNGSYNFGTKTGQVTLSGALDPGYLNIRHVMLDGTLITSTEQINFTGGPSAAHGINSFPNH